MNRSARRRLATVLLLAASSVSCSAGSKAEHGTGSDSVPPQGEGHPQSNGGAVTPSSTARGVVLFAGTSLTAGLGLAPDSAYPMLIQRKIDSAGLPFEVVNAGVSGETSSGLVDRLGWLLRARFDVLVIETGANDGLRGIPVSTLRANLETALDRIKANRPDATIVLAQMEALPNLGAKYTSEFHGVYPSIAAEKHVTLIPFLLNGVAGQRNLNQADGVHPNNTGEHIVAENVWKALRPILETRAAGGGRRATE
jgi:acyl-CoA thioesterase I